jgi:hypothetical protein
MSGEEWFDNRPCDRFPPRFRLGFSAFTAIAFPSMITIMLLAHRVLGGFWGSSEVATVFAFILGGGLAIVAVSAVLSIERRQPVGVMFGREALLARTKKGFVYTRPYSDVVRIVPLRVLSGRPPNQCQCYLVELAARIPGTRGIWLTPENKARLEIKLRDSRSKIPLYGRPRVP